MNAGALLDDGWALLRARVSRLTRRFDARPQRERMALLIACAAVALWLADKVWVTPAFNRSRAASVQLANASRDLDTLRTETAKLRAESAAQERALQADIAQARQRVATGAANLRAYQDTLVSADHMVELLEHMLPRSGRVKVVELRSLPRTDLLAATTGNATAPTAAAPASAPAAAPDAPSVYRHGVELTIAGSYADLLEYLQALEHMPRRVLWGGLSMKADQHPQVLITLRLYTLSLDKGWLEI
jgi:MSHA biogenesis protein MshJ